LDTIKALILSIHAFSQFKDADAGSLNMEALWSHSLQVAGLAKQLAKFQGADSRAAEEAFTAGMLHDIGKLVLAINLPKEVDDVWRLMQSDGVAFFQAEQLVFGANHADVGGYLIGLWGLPVPVVEAVALHHHPSRATSAEFTPLTSVHVANTLEAQRSKTPGGAAEKLDDEYLNRLGLAARLPEWKKTLYPE